MSCKSASSLARLKPGGVPGCRVGLFARRDALANEVVQHAQRALDVTDHRQLRWICTPEIATVDGQLE